MAVFGPRAPCCRYDCCSIDRIRRSSCGHTRSSVASSQFFLVAALLVSAVGATRNAAWWIVLAPQCAFYAAAIVGGVLRTVSDCASHVRWPCRIPLLANLAAAIAVVSVVVGVRYERWQPELSRGLATPAGPMEAGA